MRNAIRTIVCGPEEDLKREAYILQPHPTPPPTLPVYSDQTLVVVQKTDVGETFLHSVRTTSPGCPDTGRNFPSQCKNHFAWLSGHRAGSLIATAFLAIGAAAGCTSSTKPAAARGVGPPLTFLFIVGVLNCDM